MKIWGGNAGDEKAHGTVTRAAFRGRVRLNLVPQIDDIKSQ